MATVIRSHPLPNIHPGTPPSFTVCIEVRVLKDTLKAYLVELPNDPRGSAWLPRSIVGIGQSGTMWPLQQFFVPVWMYRKLQKQL